VSVCVLDRGQGAISVDPVTVLGTLSLAHRKDPSESVNDGMALAGHPISFLAHPPFTSGISFDLDQVAGRCPMARSKPFNWGANMPGVGLDGCGTCRFNARSKDGWRAQSDGPNFAGRGIRCTNRNVVIENAPVWTYCANYPSHNPRGIRVPIGPIYVADPTTFERHVWKPSPDTEEIRAKLLELLNTMQKTPEHEFASELCFDDELIKQLGVFGERRAVEGLRRILRFKSLANERLDPKNPVSLNALRDRATTVGCAIEALAQIFNDAWSEIDVWRDAGLSVSAEPAEELAAICAFAQLRDGKWRSQVRLDGEACTALVRLAEEAERGLNEMEGALARQEAWCQPWFGSGGSKPLG
jgi:hypothetical protein